MRNVNDLNDMHAINGLGTNDDLIDVHDGLERETEIRMNENPNIVNDNLDDIIGNSANLDDRALNNLGMRANN